MKRWLSAFSFVKPLVAEATETPSLADRAACSGEARAMGFSLTLSPNAGNNPCLLRVPGTCLHRLRAPLGAPALLHPSLNAPLLVARAQTKLSLAPRRHP